MLAFTNNGNTEAAGGDLALGATIGRHRGTDGNPTGLGGDAWLSEPPGRVQAVLGGEGGTEVVVVRAFCPEVAGRGVRRGAPRAGGERTVSVASCGCMDGSATVYGEAQALGVVERVNPAAPLGVALGGDIDAGGSFGVVAAVGDGGKNFETRGDSEYVLPCVGGRVDLAAARAVSGR